MSDMPWKNTTLPKMLAQLRNEDPTQRLHAANMIVRFAETHNIDLGSIITLVGNRADILERQSNMIASLEARIAEMGREIEILRHDANAKVRRKAVKARTREVAVNRWPEFRDKALAAMKLPLDNPPKGWLYMLAEALHVPRDDLRAYGKGLTIPDHLFTRLDTLQPVETGRVVFPRERRPKMTRKPPGRAADDAGPVYEAAVP